MGAQLTQQLPSLTTEILGSTVVIRRGLPVSGLEGVLRNLNNRLLRKHCKGFLGGDHFRCK